jgi:hypothetical protein
MLDDTGSEIDQDFLTFFLEESFIVLENLKDCLKQFNQSQDPHSFENFGQQVDRLMGASYTLSLNFFGDLSKMGKEIGYKSSQITDIEKLLVIQSLLSQLVKALSRMLKQYKKGLNLDTNEFRPLLERLEDANRNLGNLRATVKI